MAGTYPGASWAGVSPNKSPRQGKVQLFIVHHWAGGYNNPAAAAVGQRGVFMSANSRDVSPNWQVNWDGSVWEIVPPDQYRAWTTGQIDHKAVTVETQNVSGAPNWGISRESMEAIAHLVAWASARYGFPIQRGRVNSDNSVAVPGVLGHNETPAGKSTGTACPGPSMDLNWIVARAQQIANGGGTPNVPKEEDVIIYRCNKDGAQKIALNGGKWIQGADGPLRQLNDLEYGAYAFYADRGIPVRFADWTGDEIEQVIKAYGVREFAGAGRFEDGLSGRIRYTKDRVEFPGAHADNPATVTLTDAQVAALASQIKAGASVEEIKGLLNATGLKVS